MSHVSSVAMGPERGIARSGSPLVVSERHSQRLFIGVTSLLFVVSAVVTVRWCGSMSAMPGMPMPGGWTMSMAWMRMPGQTWIDAGGTFVAMWVVMMAAMMLPSLIPTLWRYRRSLWWRRQSRLESLTVIAGLGYFFVWALCGVTVFAAGVAIACAAMQSPALARSVPTAAGLVVLAAGGLQFTKWKNHRLATCRDKSMGDVAPAANARSAWRYGLRFGMHCGLSCANLTAILMVAGVMDLRAMVPVTIAITAERLAPAGAGVARVVGAIAMGTGVLVLGGVVRLG